MIIRELADEIKKQAKLYPVIAVIGPRQSGKTTLVCDVCKGKEYVNLENPNTRRLVQDDPEAFLAKYPDGAIIDEVQRVPEILSYIQVIVDQSKKKGMFILTGSHQLLLQQEITQSLAGRVALLKLLPLSISEINKLEKNKERKFAVDDFLYNGFYPRIYNDSLEPTKAYQNYLETYVEKDIRQLINLKDIIQFEKFIRLCAGRIGQVFISSNLAEEVGVSNHTINNWLSVLEASFIVFRLPPYYENFNKRIIKSPKLYFSDVGLACYLLDIESKKHLSSHPLKGQLFENMVILELIKTRLNCGSQPKFYFYRDVQQLEIDIVYKQAHQLVAVEIKSAQTYNSSLLRGINKIKKILGNDLAKSFLIYSGTIEQNVQETSLINYKNASSILAE